MEEELWEDVKEFGTFSFKMLKFTSSSYGKNFCCLVNVNSIKSISLGITRDEEEYIEFVLDEDVYWQLSVLESCRDDLMCGSPIIRFELNTKVGQKLFNYFVQDKLNHLMTD